MNGCDASKNANNSEAQRWSDAESRTIRSLSLAALPKKPTAHSNRVANSAAAAELGEKLFFDKRLSANGAFSCASCHQPERAFTDGKTRAIGVHATGRNTPTVIGLAWQEWFYWDGRKDSLWSQALVPFEAADEMGASRTLVLNIVSGDADYLRLYENVFGEFPRQLSNGALPAQAGPLGDSQTQDAWYRIPKPLQKLINVTYANLGKAIAAYERQLEPETTRFDRYAEFVANGGETGAATLTDEEIAGLALFLDQPKTQCLRCHNGPLLSNQGFHNIASGNFSGEFIDFGRAMGIQAALMDEFNCVGPYSDASTQDCKHLLYLNRDPHGLRGAFKTPTLRNIAATAPYFHDGRYATLAQVIDHYRREHELISEIQPIELTDIEAAQLAAFLATLSHPGL